MSPRDRIVARLRRLVRDAEAAGLALVADVDSTAGGIRVMTAEQERGSDLRTTGVHVALHNGCGGGMSRRSRSGDR